MIQSYSKIPHEITGIWDELELIERFEGNIDLVAAVLLGRKTKGMAKGLAISVIAELLASSLKEEFVLDMDSVGGISPSDSLILVDAFSVGFFDE